MSILNAVYRKNEAVVTRKIGDTVVLIPTQDSNNVFTLNDMAAGIWVQIDGQTPLDTIKTRILDMFEVNPSQAETDLMDFIHQLEETSMVALSS